MKEIVAIGLFGELLVLTPVFLYRQRKPVGYFLQNKVYYMDVCFINADILDYIEVLGDL